MGGGLFYCIQAEVPGAGQLLPLYKQTYINNIYILYKANF